MKKANFGFERTAFWNGKNVTCFPRTVQAVLGSNSRAKVFKSARSGCESCGSNGAECGCSSGSNGEECSSCS